LSADSTGWHSAFQTIVNKKFSNLDHFLAWNEDTINGGEHWRDHLRERASAVVAGKSLTELERTINTGARISRELRNTVQFYTWLRSQPDHDDTEEETHTHE